MVCPIAAPLLLFVFGVSITLYEGDWLKFSSSLRRCSPKYNLQMRLNATRLAPIENKRKKRPQRHGVQKKQYHEPKKLWNRAFRHVESTADTFQTCQDKTSAFSVGSGT
ncbi:hypothetical protein E0198_000908 [Clavispora lusitaniae]|nr:hypothetical protein E0198_000908 [Clavispora lusitaniae]